MSAGAPSEGLLEESGADDGDLAPSFSKGSKFAYSADFLLSIAMLDICQRLPCNFDSEILRELDERPTIWPQPKTESEFARWDGNILSTSWRVGPENGILGKNHPDSVISGKNTSESGALGQNNPENGILAKNHHESVILGKNTFESGTLGKNDPESGILGKGTLLPAPEPIAVDSAPKIHEGSTCHLLTRSATPYRPPHLYRMDLHSGTEKMDIGREKTFDSLRPRRTEVEKQKETSESLWSDRQVTQETQKNISDDQKENQDPSNATGSGDSQKYGVDESWTSEKLKSKAGQTTISCPYFLSWVKPAGNSMSSIDGKHGTGEAHMDHGTKLNEHPLTSIPSESNEGTGQSHPSTSPASVYHQQLHEWDNKATICANPSGPTQDNPEIDDADYQDLLASIEEEIACQSTDLQCSQDLSMLGFSEFDLGGGQRPIPASRDDGMVLPSEVDASSCNETILKDDEHADEVTPEVLTEQETLVDSAAPHFHEKPHTSDEICWPDEDSLITIDDFLCPMDEASSGELCKQQSCPPLLGCRRKSENKKQTKCVYAPKPMGPMICAPPQPPPGMGPWFPVLPPRPPPHPIHQMGPYPPSMCYPFGNQVHIYTNLLARPDQNLGWPWFGNA
ncbi:unnamed protein product [Linum tenue]|uniref:Uncharacterized protein n=2 Tax=Linum tenue TaxID=586396 RepID=A0AAV0IZW3_9ROSI|nr:unnamed protein product [Linum tenue]